MQVKLYISKPELANHIIRLVLPYSFVEVQYFSLPAVLLDIKNRLTGHLSLSVNRSANGLQFPLTATLCYLS